MSSDVLLPKYFQEIFAKQKWHKPSTEALMEGDSLKTGAIIADANREIFNRYLELWYSKSQSDELMDLRQAVETLRELEQAVSSLWASPPAFVWRQ
jgi:hypothetical protein